MRTDIKRARAAAFAAALVMSFGLGCSHLSYPDDEFGDEGSGGGPQSYVAPASDPDAWVKHAASGREAMRLQDLAAAEEHFVSALAATGVFPIHDARVRSALGNLLRVAAVRQSRGEWLDADRLVERVVASAHAGRLADFAAAAPVFAAQARHRAGQGDRDGAIELYEASLTLYGVRQPGNINERIGIESQLGNLYLANGQPEEAKRLLLSVLQTVQSMTGPASLDSALALLDVAQMYDAIGDTGAAERDYLRALAIQQEQIPGSLEVAKTEGQIGWFYLEHDRNEDAAKHTMAAVSLLDGRGVTSGAPLIALLDTLATAQARLGRTDLARADFERALYLYDEVDEATRARLVELLDHYAAFERSLGRSAAAEQLSERAARERTSIVGGASLVE